LLLLLCGLITDAGAAAMQREVRRLAEVAWRVKNYGFVSLKAAISKNRSLIPNNQK
jgi:hypothetical protein